MSMIGIGRITSHKAMREVKHAIGFEDNNYVKGILQTTRIFLYFKSFITINLDFMATFTDSIAILPDCDHFAFLSFKIFKR